MPNFWYPRSTTGRTFPLWESNLGERKYSGVERISALMPFPSSFSNAIGSNTVTATSANVGQLIFPCPIDVLSFSYNIGGAGNADSVMRFSLYTVDGATQIFNVTDASAAATGVRTVSISPNQYLAAGPYYMLYCLSSGSTAPAISIHGTNGAFATGASGQPDLEGVLTVSGGAAPATIDPTALTTPGSERTLWCRFDGVV